MSNPVKTKLIEGGYSVGSWITIASPTVAELMGGIGFDWLGIDGEHGAIGLESIQLLMQAMAGSPAVSLVRVATNDHILVKRVLDLGAQGVMVPMVNSAEQAEMAVRASRFPPRGVRGVGLSRAHGYSVEDRTDRLRQAEADTLLAIQIEHVDAVARIEEILRVDGVDLLFLGPEDLAASMGYLGRPEHPDVEATLSRVLAAAQRNGVPAGIPTRTVAETENRLEQGYRFIQLGVDVLYLGDSCRERCRELRRLGYDRGFAFPLSRQAVGLGASSDKDGVATA